MTYRRATRPRSTRSRTVSLRNFAGTDSFQLRYDGTTSATITSGTNYTAAGIEAAIERDPGLGRAR